MPKMLPKETSNTPVLYRPKAGNVYCNSGNNGAKYHVARDTVHNFGPRCRSRGINPGSIFAYPLSTTVAAPSICSKCFQYTEEV